MKTEIKKAKVNDSMEPIVLLGILIAGGVILWKSGAFGLLNKATKAAGTVLDDTMALPDNLVTLAGLAPQIPLAIAQNSATPQTQETIFAAASQGVKQYKAGYVSAVVGTIPKAFPGVATITQRTANMIASCVAAYPGCTALDWSAISVEHHAVYDSNGFIVSDDSSIPAPSLLAVGSLAGSAYNAPGSYIATHGGAI